MWGWSVEGLYNHGPREPPIKGHTCDSRLGRALPATRPDLSDALGEEELELLSLSRSAIIVKPVRGLLWSAR
jgi:hypothetical protein